MKAARDHTKWTNKEIEQDAQAYLAAQRAHREDQAAAADRRQEQRDREAFVAAFVKAGGTRADALDAYRERVNAQAAQAAWTADEAARLGQRGAFLGRV